MAILTPQTLGAVFSGSSYNTNLTTIEASLLDLGPMIISGLVPSAGTGLSVNVTSGVASIGGRVTVGAITIGSLTPSTTNHLYLTNAGAGTSNTSGTQPANTVKLGTATTDGSGVTSVNTTAASGRQDKNTFTAATVTTLTATTLAVTTINQTGNATLTKTPDTTTQYGVLSVGSGGFTGGGGHFSGSSNGTIFAVNMVSGGVGNVVDLQIAGVSKWKLGSGGNVTLGEGTSLVLGTATGTQIATATSQKLGFYGATPITQQAGTTDLRTGLLALGLFSSSGAMPLNTNGGDLTIGALAAAGTIGGSGTPLTLKRFSLTFPSDADYTLAAGEKDAFYIDVQNAVITATRNIIVPGAAGGTYCVINRHATQSVTLKTSGNTGITVPALRARLIGFPGGTNAFALGPSQDYTT